MSKMRTTGLSVHAAISNVGETKCKLDTAVMLLDATVNEIVLCNEPSTLKIRIAPSDRPQATIGDLRDDENAKAVLSTRR